MTFAHRAAGALCLALAATAAPAGEFAYVREIPAPRPGLVVVDVRPLERCLEKSIAGARCLPAADFLGPHRRLASWREVLWLLGTAGLRGDETVLVTGEEPLERDFVAGLLHLAGQREVHVLAQPLARQLAAGANTGPGSARGFTRRAVYEAPMRDAHIVLARELRAMRPAPLLLDGRSEAEYWGETVRAARGGHLPGAVSLPAVRLRGASQTDRPVLPEGSPVAYGHDAVEGIAYYTLLRAGSGVPARVYVEGWAEWAADGSLPADSVTHPDRAASAAAAPPASKGPPAWASIAISVALAAVAFAAGFLVRQRLSA
jgi:thiosulfate/3-mercaptopyruvate sulfurtransferase